MAAQSWQHTVVHFYSRNGITVRFEPLRKGEVPGFSHRVALLRDGIRLAKDWLSRTCRPCARTAGFFAEKHGCFAGPAATPEGGQFGLHERRSS